MMPRPLHPWPTATRLRDFQARLRNEFGPHTSPFLACAAPGAGKTTAAAAVAYRALDTGRVDYVIVLVPNLHLKKQWDREFESSGMPLKADWVVDRPMPGQTFYGHIMTYQQLAGAALNIRQLCGRTRVLGIPDEPHHIGEHLAWGGQMRQAFEPAREILLLTATPFRTSGEAIPFMPYEDFVDENGLVRIRCKPQLTYSYSQAMADGHCREVYFPAYEGRLRFALGGREHSVRFADPVPDPQARARLATAIDPTIRDGFAEHMAHDAWQKLQTLRMEGHHNAAMLVAAKDQIHARAWAALMKRITRREPVLVVSDEPGAVADLDAFCAKEATDPVVVAVKMVAEGVNAKRLRVLVWASNVETWLFFYQLVGRVLRVDDETTCANLHAFVYMPESPFLMECAREIVHERDAVLRAREETRGGPSGPRTRGDGAVPLSSEGEEHRRVHDGEVFEIENVREMQELRLEFPEFNAVPDGVFLRLVRKMRAERPGGHPPPPATPQGPTTTERLKQLRAEIERFKRKIAGLLPAEDGVNNYQKVGLEIIKTFGKGPEAMREEDATACRDYLMRWHADLT
jgi:superfamily II DNA or RNA helicase